LLVILHRHPVDLRHPGAVGERLAVSRNARLVGRDHRGVAKNRRELATVETDGNGLPGLVSFEIGEGEAARNLHGVSVLRGIGRGDDDSEQRYDGHNWRNALHLHPSPVFWWPGTTTMNCSKRFCCGQSLFCGSAWW